ncbi:Arachidonate 15-lipoxygenase B [Merluccius polli]|uniref:Arachidonate 15-lipoxygenase B n=1 Tax=Merluccius polli TaxID=89951 RepID=A0AA47PDJ0_MERPO|nr:Arachidonate 15-lipoxygenase B [Merluccius polli]
MKYSIFAPGSFLTNQGVFTPCRLSVEHVLQNWRKDSLFGSQFLNGVNPMVIRCCKELPENLPVTDDMVHLRGGRSLKEETQVLAHFPNSQLKNVGQCLPTPIRQKTANWPNVGVC